MKEEQPVATELKPRETWRIVKNVVVISIAFMTQFTAYSGAANLQSSLNAEAGTASLAAVYAGLILSSIFLPTLVINWVGAKWAMSLSFASYMPYIVAQLYPSFWTLLPAGLILGLGGGPLWCAMCTYLSVASEAHSSISKISTEILLVRFFGLFYMIYQFNQIWGNLISSLVLSSGDNVAAATSVNVSMIPELCGANFLPKVDAGVALQQQPQQKIQMMTGIYLACIAGAAIIVAVGVDSLKRYDFARPVTDTRSSGSEQLVATLKLLKEPNQMMLVLITMYVGLQQAFFSADFTAAFVSCAVGTGTVGFVMMTYGLSDAIGCMISGSLTKKIGRIPIILSGAVINSVLFVVVLVWRPHAGQAYIHYIVAVLWGYCDAVWMVQINAYYGVLFVGKEEAAFANFRIWEAVGYIIAYVISPHMRASEKTYLLIAVLFIGLSMYFTVEYRECRRNKKLQAQKQKSNCDNKVFDIASNKMQIANSVIS